MKKAHAYFRTMIKTPVKFKKKIGTKLLRSQQGNQGGVALTRYLLPIHFHSIPAQKSLS